MQMHTMTERDTRHLPVVDGGLVVGMVSIGDVVEETLSQQRQLIGQLAQGASAAVRRLRTSRPRNCTRSST